MVPAPDGNLYRTGSHVSGHDNLEPPEEPKDRYTEDGDEVYGRLTKQRKVGIVAVLSFCAFLSPVSSTSILAATPEVAAEYDTTGSVINLSNSAYMALMGVSPIVWGPMSQVFGRRIVSCPLLALTPSWIWPTYVWKPRTMLTGHVDHAHHRRGVPGA